MIFENITKLTAFKTKTLVTLLILTFLLNAPAPAAKKNDISSKTLRSMARIYMAYGQYNKAQPLAEMALLQARYKGIHDSELAMCLIDFATLYAYQDQLDRAEKMYTEGLRIKQKVHTEDHPYIAYTLKNLSSVYHKQQHYSKAIATLNKAVNIMLEYHNPDDHVMAPFYAETAKNLTAQGYLKKAETRYNQAMTLIDNSYGPDHLYTAMVRADIARLYMLQGKYDQAEKLIDRAIARTERTYGPEHHLVAPLWLTKAKVLCFKGDHEKAKLLADHALDVIQASDNANSLAKLAQDAKDILTNRGDYRHIAKAQK